MAETIRGITFEGSKETQLFDQMITGTIETADMTDMGKNYASKLFFTDTTILGPKQEFGIVDGGNGLNEGTELSKAVEIERRFGNTKGVHQKIYKNKMTATGHFYDWLRVTRTLDGANSDIQAEMLNQKGNMEYLINNGEKRKAQEMVKILTNGTISSNPNGAGSLTPDGQPLFSASHPIAITGGTQSNIQTGTISTDAEKVTALTGAVNKMRSMRFGNGDFVSALAGSTEPYVLMVAPQDRLAWTRALNGKMKTSGQGVNANQVNIFEVDDFFVRIEELPILTTFDADKQVIGVTGEAYLLNGVYLKEAKALRTYNIKPLTVTTEEIKDPRSYVAYVEMAYGCDHYGAELGIVKITGQA